MSSNCMVNKMRKLIFILISIVCFSCSNNKNKVDKVVSSYWENNHTRTNAIIDFSKEFDFDWDTLCYYSVGCSIEDINRDLGFKLTAFTDLADRMIFLKNGELVYIAGWWYDPENHQGVAIDTPKMLFRISRNRAKFYVEKRDKVFVLRPCFK